MPAIQPPAPPHPAPPRNCLPAPQDDLVCLPAKQAASLGHIGPVVVVTRVTNAITLTDPLTLRQAVLEAGAYWRNPLRPMMSSRQLTEFFILDSEIVHPTGGRAGWAGGQLGGEGLLVCSRLGLFGVL